MRKTFRPTKLIKCLFLGLCFWYFSIASLHAQEKDSIAFFPNNDRNIELGLNVTTVIASFVGADINRISPESFPLSLKIAKNRSAFRMGIGASYFSEETNTFPTFSSNTTHAYSARVGYEWRFFIAKRWMAHFGFDVVGGFLSETNRVNSSIDVSTLQREDFRMGGGPVYGLQLALSNRMVLGCEASMYGIATRSNISEEFVENPIFNRSESRWLGDFDITVPKWLYLIIRF